MKKIVKYKTFEIKSLKFIIISKTVFSSYLDIKKEMSVLYFYLI